jgi:hypothetical protein
MVIFLIAGWSRLCSVLRLATIWRRRTPRKKQEADTHADKGTSRF